MNTLKHSRCSWVYLGPRASGSRGLRAAAAELRAGRGRQAGLPTRDAWSGSGLFPSPAFTPPTRARRCRQQDKGRRNPNPGRPGRPAPPAAPHSPSARREHQHIPTTPLPGAQPVQNNARPYWLRGPRPPRAIGGRMARLSS